MNTPKTPRITQNKSDGIWFISYYQDGKRIRKSLGTTDLVAAGIKYTEFTGFLPPPPTDVYNGSSRKSREQVHQV